MTIPKHLLASTFAAFSFSGISIAAEVLFVDSETPDSSWQTLIESGGHTFTLFDSSNYSINLNDQDSVDYVEGFDVIVISGSNPNFNAVRTHGANWNTLSTPLINLGNYLISGQFSSASWRWTTPGNGKAPNASGDVDVLDPEDPIWTDIPISSGSPDTASLFGANCGHLDLNGNTFLPGITTVAAQTSDNARVALAHAAPDAVRAGSQEQYFIASFTGGSGNPVNLSDDGQTVFLNAILALTGGFTEVPPVLMITPNASTPGSYDFEWDSRDGKVYDLVSATNLSVAPDTWAIWDAQADLAATPPANTLSNIPGGGDMRRFFAVVEKDAPPPPPLLSEDFEGGAIPAGWTTSGTGTTWSVGTPNGDGSTNTEPSAAAGGTFCAGTNMNGKYGNSADARLVTPAFTVPAGGATLELDYYIDTEAGSGGADFGSIRLLDATDDSPLAGGEVAPDLQGTSLSWNLGESLPLPAAANGLEVKLEFGFVSDDAGENWAGFYIDNVVVTPN